jgi:serine/threonine protein kinase
VCSVTERGTFSEDEAACLIKQVLEGVAYLHFKGIVHGDLKLENILLEGNLPCVTVKIADFGLSKVFVGPPTRATVCGSPLYMAPELLTLDQKSELAPAVDVWSVGVILFILLAGYAPFGAILLHLNFSTHAAMHVQERPVQVPQRNVLTM